jgi:hypothetical protein
MRPVSIRELTLVKNQSQPAIPARIENSPHSVNMPISTNVPVTSDMMLLFG